MKTEPAGRSRGFTLIELMVVISIILILLSMALPIYSHSVMRKREENLRQNLETLNKVVVQYTLDKKKAPKSLDDLVEAGYLKPPIPEDITGRDDTWVLEEDDTIMSPEQTAAGVSGVHSGSNQIAGNGTAYSSW
jgi:general secretion pathway protein G